MFPPCRVKVHLTVVAVELQPETPSVGQDKEERLPPRRLLSAPSGAVAERIADAMPALHEERRIAGVTCLKGRMCLRQPLLCIKAACGVVGDVVQVGEFPVLGGIGHCEQGCTV